MKDITNIKPPRLASLIFDRYAHKAFAEDLKGDLDELFYLNLERMPLWKARLIYWRHVISFLFSYVIATRKRKVALHPYSSTSITISMLISYFLIAIRTVRRNIIYSIINVLGLALGICACLIIFLVTRYEFSFDKFHPDSGRIFRVEIQTGDQAGTHRCICSPPPAAPTFRDVSDIEVVAPYHRYDPKIEIAEKDGEGKHFDRQSANLIIAGSEYFNVLPYTWLAGNMISMNEPFKVVLTENRAKIYFGTIPVDQMLGRVITYNDSLNVVVAGIIKDRTENTDFTISEAISFATIHQSFLKQIIPEDNWEWFMHSSQTLVKTREGKSKSEVSAQMTSVFRKHFPGDPNAEVVLNPMSEIHFNNNDHEPSMLLATLYVMGGLASFILILAAINFVNLSTAQSLQRTKEIGVRKTLGGFRSSIVLQFLTETFVLSTIAGIIAILITQPVLNLLAAFIPQGVELDLFNSTLWLFLGILLFVTTLLAGFYPAKVLSAFRPAISLRGNNMQPQGRGWYLRKSLIVFQYAFSLIFIVATLVMNNQLAYMRSKDRGFRTDAIVTLRSSWNDPTSNVKVLAQQVRQLSQVEGVALQSLAPMGFAMMFNTVIYKGDSTVQTSVSIKACDSQFIPVYNLRILAGRNIVESDSLKEFVINDRYRKVLGFKTPEEALGEQLYFNDKPYAIVGVLADFHQQSFREAMVPTVLGNFNDLEHSIGVKISATAMASDHGLEVMREVEKKFKALFPDEPFDYHFIEEEIDRMLNGERKIESLANIAMVVTIFIASLGVFGLSMFTAEMKKKEIGVRKVLGAKVPQITTALSQEFLILILIGVGVASPIAWFLMSNWLSLFAYRVELSVLVFFEAAAIAVLVGLGTVSFHTIRAARANPVDALRTE